MFKRGIQHTVAATQVKALVDGNLTGVLVYLAFHHEGRLTLARVDLDDAVGQVAILHRGNTRDDFNAFDVGGTDGTCRGCQRLARLGIVAHAHAVHFDGGAERGVAFLRRPAAQSHTVVVDQCRVGGLATGQQGVQVADVEYLLVVECRPVDGVRRGALVGLALGRHRHLV